MKPLVRRKKATDATIAKFGGKPFAWGSVDCAKMVAFHLKQFGVKVRLSKAGQYKTAKGAIGALKRLGYETLPGAMDGHGFDRIPVAFALAGDVVSFPSDHDIGALGIVVGNGNMLAFHEMHEGLVHMTMGEIDACWKVL